MIHTKDMNEVIQELDLKKRQFEDALSAMKSSLVQEGALTNLIENHPPYALLAECFLVGFSLRDRYRKIKEVQ